MDDQTISHFRELTALDLDEAAADVCRRCSGIPWANAASSMFSIWIKSVSPTCRICRLLQTKSAVGKLSCVPVPIEIGELLDKHKFQCRAFFRMHERYFLVLDLSHEQAALQLLSIFPVMPLSKIKDHIRDCVANHGRTCALRVDRKPLHLRVIDCNTRTVIDAPTDCDFVALSYVWGGVYAVQEPDMTQDIPLTIEHSMYVTVELGFKYLWTDRYCINQQDQQHKDDQINQMSTIYNAAQLTIVAAAGSDPTHGLPGLALHPRPGIFATYENLDKICLFALKDETWKPENSLYTIATSVWASRAWTYQEAMFSRRRLIFTENQAIFSCNKNTYLESGEVFSEDIYAVYREIVPWYNLVELPSDHEMRPILEIMEQYCIRKLSYESDALRAISGTLNLLLKDEQFHLWGVPGRILKPVSTDREKQQQTPKQMSSKEAARMSDDLDCLFYINWHRLSKGYRRPAFPSWSPLGWSSGSMFWRDELAYIGRISFHTSSGQKDISECIQYVRADHTRIPQQLNLSLKTAIAEIFQFGLVALFKLNSQLQVISDDMSWDGYEPADGTYLKAAVIAESDKCIHLLLLEATGDDIYERRGSCRLYRQMLVDPEYEEGYGKAKEASIRYNDLKQTRYMSVRHLDPVDQEQLGTSFGDLETYEWWKHIFTEERIILG